MTSSAITRERRPPVPSCRGDRGRRAGGRRRRRSARVSSRRAIASSRGGRPTARCGSAPANMPTGGDGHDLERRVRAAGSCADARAAARSRAPPAAADRARPRGCRASSSGAARRPRSARRTRRRCSGRSRPTAATWATAADGEQPRRGDQQQLAGVERLRRGRAAGQARVAVTVTPSPMTRSGALGSSWSCWWSRSPSGGGGSTRRGRLPAARAPARHERLDHAPGRSACPRTCAARRWPPRPGRARTVGRVGGHRVEGVGHGDDPGELRDLVAGQAHRVARAVDAARGGA